jgi:lyso-ornithine lipid O-acyltransferase
MAVLRFTAHAAGLALATLLAFADMARLWLFSRGNVSLRDRALWLHRWCRFALPKLGVHSEVAGRVPETGLIVSNHLSYLDIMVFSAVAPVLFVSKHEVRSWPIFGLLAHLAGTRFLDRARAADAHRVQNEVQEALDQGCRVVIFPEGTSTNGESVLPFKPALFESAVGRHNVTVAHISYNVSSGTVGDDVCYWGEMTFVPHIVRLLSKQRIEARVRFGTSARFNDRKQAAQETNRLVTAMMSS